MIGVKGSKISKNLWEDENLARCIYLSRQNERHHGGKQKGKKPGGGHTKWANRKENLSRKGYLEKLLEKDIAKHRLL